MNWLTTIFQSMSRPLKWWVVVASWEQGVLVRLGKRTRRLDPGLHFRIPFLDRVYVQSTRLRVAQANGQSVSTRDGKVVTFNLAIRYLVADVVKLYEAVADVEAVLAFDAVSTAATAISGVDAAEMDADALEVLLNVDAPAEQYGLASVNVIVTNFCVVRCLRILNDNSWIATGKGLDDRDQSGEV